MSKKMMWLGTKGFETWVPAPAIDPQYSRGGYLSSTPLLNGGVSIDASKNAHMIYSLSWPKGRRADLRTIMDFADGVYDTANGVNPIYWIDPVAADVNVLPQHWATPALAVEDAPSLLTGKRPTAVPGGHQTWRFPSRSARYAQTTTDTTAKLYIPIPPGYTLWAGVLGDAAAAGRVLVRDINGTVDTSTTTALPLAPGGGTWTTTAFARTATRTGVQLELKTGSAATFTLTGLTAVILPTGKAPATGLPWASGQGHSGCAFATRPTMQPHSVPLDLVAVSAVLEEVGAYL